MQDILTYRHNFLGTALEIYFPGCSHIKLMNTSDNFVCQRPAFSLSNIMSSHPTIDI